jgi:hypothetical protein
MLNARSKSECTVEEYTSVRNVEELAGDAAKVPSDGSLVEYPLVPTTEKTAPSILLISVNVALPAPVSVTDEKLNELWRTWFGD